MISPVDSLHELLNGTEEVECYVSTDRAEVEAVLGKMGFYQKDGELTYRCPFSWLQIDCRNIPLEEAVSMRTSLGFPAMSKFRVRLDGSIRDKAQLAAVAEALKREKQNTAFLSRENGSTYSYTELHPEYLRLLRTEEPTG